MQLMLDIETLGTAPGSVIIEIAAVPFNFGKTTRIEDADKVIRVFPDIAAQLQLGMTIDPGTVQWWTSDPQRLQLFAASMNQPVRLPLDYVANFLNDAWQRWACVALWANSPSFDVVLLEDLYRRVNVKPAWAYHQTRDLRTLIWATGHERSRELVPAPALQHDALADCRYQIQVAQYAHNELRRQ